MESDRIQRKDPRHKGTDKMNRNFDYLGALSSNGIPGTVVMHVGAKLDELYSGYALTAKMPDGRLLFKGPCFLEGHFEDTNTVKLIAIRSFLNRAEDVFGRYGDGLKLFLWSADEKLNRSWRTYLDARAAGREDPSLWDPVVKCLAAHSSEMEVVGPAG